MVGELLRDWRRRRRLSQLDLAVAAGVSSRHLSFVVTGRSKPSRELLLHLAEHLDVPLRERNSLLLAAGYAPTFRETPLAAPELAPVRAALDTVLAGHDPYPALVVDRRWDVVAMNRSVALLLEGVDPSLLEAPNALRIALSPSGLRPRIVNLAEWSEHLLDRLRRQVLLTGDDDVRALHDELAALPLPDGSTPRPAEQPPALAVPLRLRHDASDGGELRFLSTVTTFGTALDVTLAELSLEAFLPADEATAAALRLAPTPTLAEGRTAGDER
jgi:transcriptional regulator with XRE-family HTH domain